MQGINRNLFIVLILSLITNILVGCGGKEERKAKYIERGKVYLEQASYEKAAIEFKNVVQIDPMSAEAYYYLGQIEEQTNNLPIAFGDYKHALELDPGFLDARAKLAHIHLASAISEGKLGNKDAAASEIALAQEQIEEILNREPGHSEALTLQASLWMNSGEKEKGLRQLKSILSREPGQETASLLLAMNYDADKQFEEAEQVLLKAISNTDKSEKMRGMLIRFYQKNEQFDKAERMLNGLIEDYPEKLGYRSSMAIFLAQKGQLDRGEKVLRDTLAEEPTDVRRHMMLVDFLEVRRGKEAAISEMEKTESEYPELSEVQFRLIKNYLEGDNKANAEEAYERLIDYFGDDPPGLQARVGLAESLASDDREPERVNQLINEVLNENPSDNGALLLKGRIAGKKKDWVTAVNSFRAVLRDQPGSLEVLKLLAAAHSANDDNELALDTLSTALELAPTDIGVRLQMARLLVYQRDIDGALKHARIVNQQYPDNQQVLDFMFDLHSLKGDADEMAEVASILQSQTPANEDSFIREARIFITHEKFDKAQAIIDDVLNNNPASVQGLLAKSDILAAQEKNTESLEVIRQLQKTMPDNAIGYFREGKLHQVMENPDAAIKAYQRALEITPQSTNILAALVDVEMSRERPDKAIEIIQDTLEKYPQHKSANKLLGSVYMTRNYYKKAESAFKKQIKVNPQGGKKIYQYLADSRAMQGNLAGAALAYETGLVKYPDSARLEIGLAGIRERQKDFDASISIYKKVLEKHPANLLATNNLAALLSEQRTDKESLDSAAELAVILSQNTDEPVYLDTAGWVHYRRGEYDKAVDILRGVVEKLPDVHIFQYHLGMAYLKSGDKLAAREHLSKAVGEDVEYDGVKEAKAELANL